ncbi:hypothetical protein OOK31_05320 [Streptomyces sp. NBC_00249]|uniref:hypothetical protein n=1 Tax=Streptomyces sp. NBC_00249 TaxID=2975690 RepID=UPI002256FCB0|nr:hypothetical protein [Streptomyces sp. NBC_00249]MCX5193314.1 hypothetical protein [Streptomyces sp. NBC_00249]
MPASDHDVTADGRGPGRRRPVLLGGGALIVLVAAYFILAATIPRWWSQRVGAAVDGHLGTGLVLGLVFGIACTLLPLMVAWIGLHKRRSWKATAGWLALAVVLALPNLWTLSLVAGGGSASHAGQRVMDVEAPWFRGATLAGAITSVVAFAGFLVFARKRRGRPAKREA